MDGIALETMGGQNGPLVTTGDTSRNLLRAAGVVNCVPDLVLLTWRGCVNGAQFQTALDRALKSLGLPTDYTIIDVDKLQPFDPRRGYGSPTVLFNGRDLFGMIGPAALSGALF